MRLFAYGCRPFDEEPFFLRHTQELGVTLGLTHEPLREDTVALCAGYDHVSIMTHPVPAPLLEQLWAQGVKMLSTRTVGYDHIDCRKARELGLRVSNVSYAPESVADYSILLILMTLRKMKRMMQRAAINDFTLQGLSGGLLCERTVGIIGTGRIGRAVIRDLRGFGCKVYAYDHARHPETQAEYLPLEQLYERCDLISLHTPLTEKTYHMIGPDALARMPDGVILINTGRGALIDSDALIDALEAGKVGGCGLDVVEDEFHMYYFDRRHDVLGNRRLSILRDMPNVLVTPHMAFYTDRSVSDMVHNSILSCLCHSKGLEDPWRVV